jgi:adenylate kinase family enzyme
MRIHITGNAGSGKSTFAINIGDILGLHVYGLDKIVWKEGWGKTPLHERKNLEEELAAKQQWIIEGVSSIARQAADVTIFLDFPRSVCYLRCVKRNWRYLFSSRPGLPDNCPEIKIIPTLAKIIWQFPYMAKPIIVNEMDAQNKEIITISSNGEISQFISKLRHNKALKRDSENTRFFCKGTAKKSPVFYAP